MKLVPMLWAVALITVLAVGVAVATPKPCCFPEKYEAYNGASVGQVLSTGTEGFFVNQHGGFDYSNRQFGFFQNVTFPDETFLSYRIIQKFEQKKQWIINDTSENCTEMVLSEVEPFACIPDNATFYQTMHVGGVDGTDGVLVDVWGYTFTGKESPIQGELSISVTHTGCVPVGSSFLGARIDGPTPVPFTSSGGLYNVTKGIPDPKKWFNVPTFCDNKTNHVGRVSREVHKTLEHIKMYGVGPFF